MTDQQDLDALCKRLGLSQPCADAVSEAVIRLTNFELHKAEFKSGSARIKELKALRVQLAELRKTLNGLDLKTYSLMGYALGDVSFPGTKLNPNAGQQLKFDNWGEGVDDALKRLAVAATLAARRIPKDTIREGRKSLTEIYAVHISNLANIVCWQANELKFGRNNDFHRLCDAIFKVARVPATSEGAIKFLQAHIGRNDYRKTLLTP